MPDDKAPPNADAPPEIPEDLPLPEDPPLATPKLVPTDFFAWLCEQETRPGRKLAPSTADVYTRTAVRIAHSRHRYNPQNWLIEHLSAATANSTRQNLCAAATWYAKWLELHGRDAPKPKLPALPTRRERVRSALTEDELVALYAQLEEGLSARVRTILRLLPRTGLRVGEIVALRRTDYQIHERRPHLQVLGKGDKIRWVPLNPAADEILRAYLVECALELRGSEWLFPSPKHKQRDNHLGTAAVREAIKGVLRDKLGPWASELSPHILRHTFATRAYERGVDLAHIKELLGHTRMDTTMRYARPTTRTLGAAVDKLDEE